MPVDVTLIGPAIQGVENHAIGALRAALHAAELEERFVPFTGFWGIERLVERVLTPQPRVVGISLQTIESALATVALARLLRGRGYRGRIVFGGHFATLNAEDLLNQGSDIDAVVQFAGEEALVAIARGALDDDVRARQVPGLVFRDKDGVVRRGASPRWTSPTVLARAARFEPLPEHLGFGAADLVASRGCEAHCSYCCVAAASDLARRESAHSAGQPGEASDRAGTAEAGYERRSFESLCDEIAMLYHEHGARVFNFMDDNVLPLDADGAAEWARTLRRALDAQRVGPIALSLQLRADSVTERSADALVELGLARAYVGIDGYSPSQLRALGRKADAACGNRALELLWARGVFSIVNALLLGPTIAFESVRDEIEGLSRIRRAPVHLLPIEVRAGTAYFRAAARRGLVEGGFLHWHYRFADARTQRMAEMLTAFPSRLAERSVPIALYDLGYNLGIARRLLPEIDLGAFEATYSEVTNDWNRDQLRVLTAAASVAVSADPDAPRNFVARELAAVTGLDDSLRDKCDRAITEIERLVSVARRRPVSAHCRGKLLGVVAFSMSLAACGGSVTSRSDRDASTTSGGTGGTAGTGGIVTGTGGFATTGGTGGTAGSPPLTPCDTRSIQEVDAGASSFDVPAACACGALLSCLVTFDAEGRAVDFQMSDGSTIEPLTSSCLAQLFAQYCYPSLAGTTQTFQSHCWVA